MRRIVTLFVSLAVFTVTPAWASTVGSAKHHYSVAQVKHAFADQGVYLAGVPYREDNKKLMFLYAKPGSEEAGVMYVFVKVAACKCAVWKHYPHARKTRHGNVTVFWLARAKAIVSAALSELK